MQVEAGTRREAARSAVSRLRRYEEWALRVYRIRDRAGEIVPLRLNRVQRAIGEAERRALAEKGRARIFVLKARRPGVSTDQQARCLHQIWSLPRFDALSLAHTGEDRLKFFEITQRAIDHFPPALLPRLGDRETTEISFPALDSHFYTGTAGAKRIGRGMTLRRMHGSEFAYWDDPLGTLNTITPAMEGVPQSVVVLETTPSGYDTEGHRFWRRAVSGETEYRPLFFPWWECDAVNYRERLLAPDELGALSKEEEGLRDRWGLDFEQLKWRRSGIATMGRADFFKEYPEDAESCWALAGGLYYDADILRNLSQRTLEPIRAELNGAMRLYREIPHEERVIIGADTAEGVSGSAGGSDHDRSAFVARGFPSGKLVADFEDRIVAPEGFAALLAEWGKKLSKRGAALLVVEKNAHGITVLRRLRDHHHYPLERIYRRTPLDAEKDDKDGRLGWATTAQSKPVLLDAGRQILAAAEAGTADPPPASALRDAFSVRRDERGSADLQGRDVLVSDMLAWVGRESPQLAEHAAGVIYLED